MVRVLHEQVQKNVGMDKITLQKSNRSRKVIPLFVGGKLILSAENSTDYGCVEDCA